MLDNLAFLFFAPLFQLLCALSSRQQLFREAMARGHPTFRQWLDSISTRVLRTFGGQNSVLNQIPAFERFVGWFYKASSILSRDDRQCRFLIVARARTVRRRQTN